MKGGRAATGCAWEGADAGAEGPDTVARIPAGAAEVEAADGSTVRFRYTRPSPASPLDTYQGIYPENLWIEEEPDG